MDNLTLQAAEAAAVDSADATGRVHIVYRKDGRHGDSIYAVCREAEWTDIWNTDWTGSRILPGVGYCVAVRRILPHVGP